MLYISTRQKVTEYKNQRIHLTNTRQKYFKMALLKKCVFVVLLIEAMTLQKL